MPTNTTTAVNTNPTADNENESMANISIPQPDTDRGNSASTSWAKCVANLNESDFTVVTNKRHLKSTVMHRVKVLKGTKATDGGASSSSVRGVPRRLTAYAGRHHKVLY